VTVGFELGAFRWLDMYATLCHRGLHLPLQVYNKNTEPCFKTRLRISHTLLACIIPLHVAPSCDVKQQWARNVGQTIEWWWWWWWWCCSGFWHRVCSSVDANISEKHTEGLKMETVCFSKTLASTDESTRRQNPEHHPHRRENLKSKITECMELYLHATYRLRLNGA
jgi:hypothetical protein